MKKSIWANLALNLLPLTCVIAAAVIAIQGRDGWGWFLFVAVICGGGGIEVK